MSKRHKNIAIFASGNGTNAMNILDCASENLNHSTVKCLITDNKSAGIINTIKKCKKYNKLPIIIIPFARTGNQSHAEAKYVHETEIYKALQLYEVNWIALAGYMRILSRNFLNLFFDKQLKLNRIVNIHPSLLPKYPGKNAYEQAFLSGDDISGVTIHYVDSGIDTGLIILQKKFHRKKEDTLEQFKARGLNLEYKVYREALIQLDKN
jgi:phosphoribosylglycinamide formyltransferase 1